MKRCIRTVTGCERDARPVPRHVDAANVHITAEATAVEQRPRGADLQTHRAAGCDAREDEVCARSERVEVEDPAHTRWPRDHDDAVRIDRVLNLATLDGQLAFDLVPARQHAVRGQFIQGSRIEVQGLALVEARLEVLLGTAAEVLEQRAAAVLHSHAPHVGWTQVLRDQAALIRVC
jgi:hypothetical protein